MTIWDWIDVIATIYAIMTALVLVWMVCLIFGYPQQMGTLIVGLCFLSALCDLSTREDEDPPD